jgi:hypothetical protein
MPQARTNIPIPKKPDPDPVDQPMLGDLVLYHVPKIGQEGARGDIPGFITYVYGEGRVELTLMVPGRWGQHGNFTAEEMKYGSAQRGPVDRGSQNWQWSPA